MAVLTPATPSPRRLARRLTLIAGLLLPGSAEVSAQGLDGGLAQQIRAAYLLNFTRYVDWPPAAFSGPDDPVKLCVVESGGFEEVVRGAVEGRRSRNRPVRVLVPDTPSQAAGCHLIYLAGAQPVVAQWMEALAGSPTLTVGEGRQFLAQGGVVGFVTVEETIRFEIDQRPARRGGLQISSRVLQLATRVHGGDPAR